jgi:serine/threonine-protein kinase
MPSVGDVLGERYRIEGVLGAGGMASVYRATDLRLEREVAVKVLLPNLARDPSLADRFDREARMLAAVAHPGVAAVFDVDGGDPAIGREPFYVMELCDGGSLADRIEAGGRLDPGDVIPTITAVAQGLAELHQQGLIHRDVKPGNILFCGGRPKLADFGLARADASSDQTTLTAPGTTVGTLGYLAPELLRGGQPTIASDTYGLGVTAFHALTGGMPWPGDRLADVAAAETAPAPLVSSVAPPLGTAFDGACAAALASDPGRRPGPQRFAADLEEALARWMEDPGAPAADSLTETVVVTPVPLATGAESAAQPAAALPAAALPAAEPAAAAIRPSPSPAERSGTVGDANPTTRVLAVLGILALALAVAVLGALFAQGGPEPSATAPVPGSSPTPSPAATVDAPSAALPALDAVVAAIDQARGGRDGLRGNDANDLQALAEDVRQALAAGDVGAARIAAERLEEHAADVTDELDEARRDALEAAIDALLEAIPGD